MRAALGDVSGPELGSNEWIEPSDQEMEAIYTQLRRRPDGKSSGPIHDSMWQAAALMAGLYVLSQAEFEAVFGRLARSAAAWSLRPISRNYFGYLRTHLAPTLWGEE